MADTTPRRRGSRGSDIGDFFFQTPDQVVELVRIYADRILSAKLPESALLTPYREFNYRSELASITWPETGRSADEFLEGFVNFFENAINFDAPGVLYNVHPNVNLVGQVSSFVASIANPNLCMDIPAGKLLLLEKAVSGYLASLAGWDSNSGGVFTFGGKGTLLYALKMALHRTTPSQRDDGLTGSYRVISNVLGHPSHVEVCNWTGIGQRSCMRLPVVQGRVEAEEIERALDLSVEKGARIPLIIVNGMTTNSHTFDPIAEIVDVRDRVVRKHGLDYEPWVHVDSVLGWVYLVASRYDFDSNPLGLSVRSLGQIHAKVEDAAAFGLADSFAADFHKTGFCSYASSAIVVRDKRALFDIQGHYAEGDELKFTQHAPYDYTLESSRSSHGPVSAFATLQTLGANGFTQILSNQTDAYLELKGWLDELEYAVVCNRDEESNLVFVAFLPSELQGTQIDESLSEDLVERIREFNTGFHAYLMERLAIGSSPLFFSVSRSYRYKGHSLGCLKLYSFNSTFNPETAKTVFSHLVQLLDDYQAHSGPLGAANSFDFTRVGESGGV